MGKRIPTASLMVKVSHVILRACEQIDLQGLV